MQPAYSVAESCSRDGAEGDEVTLCRAVATVER